MRIGTSGWSYPHWRGVLYPEGTKPAEYLTVYARTFPTTEINASFYHAPHAETFRKWGAAVPGPFVFAVKAHRSITHDRRLEAVETQWLKFVSAARELGAKLGPVLLQFPPSFRSRPRLLAAFLEAHGRAFGGAVRLAFEFRHASWFEGDAVLLPEAHGAALVLADSSRYPMAPPEHAGAFVYLRFHGPGAMFSSSYTDGQLRGWAERIRRWLREGRDVYAYFNNDAAGCAVRNALRLRELAGAL